MSLSLNKAELYQLSSISGKKILKLINSGPKKQSLIIGDSGGKIICIGIEKELTELWTGITKVPSAITKIEASGLDKVFISSGHSIEGWNKKGKNFFRITTNNYYAINSFAVMDTYLWIASNSSLNIYNNGKAESQYWSSDVINDICVDCLSEVGRYQSVLGCQDRAIRIVENDTLLSETPVEGPVEIIAESSDPKATILTTNIIYGTSNGMIGQLICSGDQISKGFIVPNDNDLGGITSLTLSDIDVDGKDEVIVGRESGTIQIFSPINITDTQLLYETSLGESIRGLDVGSLHDTNNLELYAATYTGRIVNFMRQDGNNFSKPNDKISSLQKEIEQLERLIQTEKPILNKYNNIFVPVKKLYDLSHTIVLDPDKALYTVSIELPVRINTIIMKTEIPLELIDSDRCDYITTKTISKKNTKECYSFKIQNNLNRIEIKFRTVEGNYGLINFLVLPNGEPKIALPLELSVKPLSLHHKIIIEDSEIKTNELNISGDFDTNVVYEWVQELLPEVPSRKPDNGKLVFTNTFIGSVLICKFLIGAISFYSNNISTLKIIHDYIMKISHDSYYKIAVTYNVDPNTIKDIFTLLHPKLDYTLKISNNYYIKNALKEITSQEDGNDFFNDDFKAIIKNSDQIDIEFKQLEHKLTTLCDIVVNIFKDTCKYKGIPTSEDKIKALDKLLKTDYSYDKLMKFIDTPL